jgi:hypothetical protein
MATIVREISCIMHSHLFWIVQVKGHNSCFVLQLALCNGDNDSSEGSCFRWQSYEVDQKRYNDGKYLIFTLSL